MSSKFMQLLKSLQLLKSWPFLVVLLNLAYVYSKTITGASIMANTGSWRIINFQEIAIAHVVISFAALIVIFSHFKYSKIIGTVIGVFSIIACIYVPEIYGPTGGDVALGIGGAILIVSLFRENGPFA